MFFRLEVRNILSEMSWNVSGSSSLDACGSTRALEKPKKKLARRAGMLYTSIQSHTDCRILTPGMMGAAQFPAHRRAMIFLERSHTEHLTDLSDRSGHAVTDP